MKHCRNCEVDVDNSFNLCPYCGQTLTSTQAIRDGVGETPIHSSTDGPSDRTHISAEPPSFQTVEGRDITFNGQIVDSNTQQYYQSKLTKIIQAVFYGEPYQLSHTTFVTAFRIEEHVQHGFAEQARDIVVYGQLQNVLSAGDDVTVVARREGDRLVAKSIVNHSSEAQVIPHGGIISAGLVRAAVIIPLAILIMLLIELMLTPSNVIVSTLANILWPIILIGAGIAWVKGKFKRK